MLWMTSSFVQGSSAELREVAAEGLGELVDVTSQEALRPFTVQITGTPASFILRPWRLFGVMVLHQAALMGAP